MASKNPTQVPKQNALLVGDMNSYAKEAPILAFEKANYKVLLNDAKVGQGAQAYSYVLVWQVIQMVMVERVT